MKFKRHYSNKHSHVLSCNVAKCAAYILSLSGIFQYLKQSDLTENRILELVMQAVCLLHQHNPFFFF